MLTNYTVNHSLSTSATRGRLSIVGISCSLAPVWETRRFFFLGFGPAFLLKWSAAFLLLGDCWLEDDPGLSTPPCGMSFRTQGICSVSIFKSTSNKSLIQSLRLCLLPVFPSAFQLDLGRLTKIVLLLIQGANRRSQPVACAFSHHQHCIHAR